MVKADVDLLDLDWDGLEEITAIEVAVIEELGSDAGRDSEAVTLVMPPAMKEQLKERCR